MALNSFRNDHILSSNWLSLGWNRCWYQYIFSEGWRGDEEGSRRRSNKKEIDINKTWTWMPFLCRIKCILWLTLKWNGHFFYDRINRFEVIFWIVAAVLFLAIANASYVGYLYTIKYKERQKRVYLKYGRYSFHQGEIRSIYLLKTLRWIFSLFVSVLFIPILCIPSFSRGYQ